MNPELSQKNVQEGVSSVWSVEWAECLHNLEVEIIGTVFELGKLEMVSIVEGSRETATLAWSEVLKSDLVSTHTGNQLQNNGIQAGEKRIHMGIEGISGADVGLRGLSAWVKGQ